MPDRGEKKYTEGVKPASVIEFQAIQKIYPVGKYLKFWV